MALDVLLVDALTTTTPPTAPTQFLAGTVQSVTGTKAQVAFVAGTLTCEIPASLTTKQGDVVIVANVLYGTGSSMTVIQVSRRAP